MYNKIMKYCKENNMPLSAFEQMCDIGNATIEKWNPKKEKPSKPTLTTMEKIADKTGIPLTEWLLEDREE